MRLRGWLTRNRAPAPDQEASSRRRAAHQAEVRRLEEEAARNRRRLELLRAEAAPMLERHHET